MIEYTKHPGKTTTNMRPDPLVMSLLRSSACVEFESGNQEAFRRLCRSQKDWNQVVRQAELHGMAPYLQSQVSRTGVRIPDKTRKELRALSLRHTDAARIRTRALLEILTYFGERGIDILVLKGSALAHLIYDRPGLRPMSDIDVLVAPEMLTEASRVASELGYAGGSEEPLPDHHHLPTIGRMQEGLRVSLEIHHDALSRDNIGSIRMDRLSEPSREFPIGTDTARALGHLDMLRHLCRHALEPRESTKLGSALDIMMYAVHYRGEIDWKRLQTRYPEVVTMIRLLGYLVPWPGMLSPYVDRPDALPPDGIGVGVIPLSRLRHQRNWAARLLNPSDWWMRCFYNVPPGRSLAYTKTVRHPVRAAFWMWRRTGKILG